MMSSIVQSPQRYARIGGVLCLAIIVLGVFGEAFALLATVFNLIQTAVLAANKMTLLAPILLLGDANSLGAFSPDQLHALSYLAIQAHGYGFGVGLIFFGFACLRRRTVLRTVVDLQGRQRRKMAALNRCVESSSCV